MNKNTFGKYDFEAPIQYGNQEPSPEPQKEENTESSPQKPKVKKPEASAGQPAQETRQPETRQPEERTSGPKKTTETQQAPPPEKKKKKSSALPIIAAVTVILVILGAAIMVPVSKIMEEKALQQKIQENLHAGDEALKMGYYETAIAHYESAGEAGQQKILETKLQRFLEQSDSEDYAAIRELAKEIDDTAELESLIPVIMRKVRKLEVHGIIGRTSKENERTHAECTTIHEFLQLVPKSGSKEYRDMTDILYTSLGYLKALETAETEENDFTAARFYWEKCSEVSFGRKIIDGIKHIEEGRYIQGIDELLNLMGNDPVSRNLLITYSGERPTDSIDNSLQYDVSHRKITAPNDEALSEVFASKDPITAGIHTHCKDHPLDADGITEMKEKIGTSPAGKVLILHRIDPYYSEEREYFLHTELMASLPDGRFPTSLAEVEYVILLDTTYEEAGEYQIGTIRIKEYTAVQVFSAKTGSQLYSSTASGPVSDTMYYFFFVPKYYTAGSPEIKNLLIEACRKIEEIK